MYLHSAFHNIITVISPTLFEPVAARLPTDAIAVIHGGVHLRHQLTSAMSAFATRGEKAFPANARLTLNFVSGSLSCANPIAHKFSAGVHTRLSGSDKRHVSSVCDDAMSKGCLTVKCCMTERNFVSCAARSLLSILPISFHFPFARGNSVRNAKRTSSSAWGRPTRGKRNPLEGTKKCAPCLPPPSLLSPCIACSLCELVP
jgi:hypothetical protein